MNNKAVTLVGSLIGLMIVGCARPDDHSQSTAEPTTRPAVMVADRAAPPVARNTAPSATEPSGSVMLVDRAQFFFPPARMRLSKEDGRVVVRLYSEDPSPDSASGEAINSYDLIMTMPVSVHEFADVPGSKWESESMSMEREYTPYGISLNNQHDVLQPQMVKVHFGGEVPEVGVYVSGTFVRFHTGDDEPNATPTTVLVRGLLQATVVNSK